MELGALGVDLVALEVDCMPWRWMSNWYHGGDDLGALQVDLGVLGMNLGALGIDSNHLRVDLGRL